MIESSPFGPVRLTGEDAASFRKQVAEGDPVQEARADESYKRRLKLLATVVPQHCLTKMSGPGWTRKYASELDARLELYRHICDQCRAEEGLDEHSSIYDMLVSACGCEYDYEPLFTRLAK